MPANTLPIKDRHAKLLELLPKNNFNITKSAMEAGFTEKTAHKQQKSLILTALKKQKALDAQTRKEAQKNPKKEVTDLYSRIGLTRSDITDAYKTIVKQERDYSTKLKAISPFLREEGIHFDEKQTVNAPTLNIVVAETNTGTSQPAEMTVTTEKPQKTPTEALKSSQKKSENETAVDSE